MIVRLSLPDHVYDAYDAFAAGGGVTPEILMVQQLERFRGLHPQKPTLLVGELEKAKLARLLHGGMLKDAKDLVEKVERLAGIEFHLIRLDFSPGQLEELARMADRRGCTVETICTETVRGMEGEFFNRTAGDGPVLVAGTNGSAGVGHAPRNGE